MLNISWSNVHYLPRRASQAGLLPMRLEEMAGVTQLRFRGIGSTSDTLPIIIRGQTEYNSGMGAVY